MLSKSFIMRWQNCRSCDLHKLARAHVIGKGDTPADVLFLGEAPGPIEDLTGHPFVGRAGKLLDQILDEVSRLEDSVLHFTRFISNIVACAPWIDELRKNWREPSSEEAQACSPRLAGIMEAVHPKTIIFVGQVAKKFFKAPSDTPTLTIVHPSSILRLNVAPVNTVIYHQTIHRIREHLQEVL